MPYQVLALKYRPQIFADVVGQEHVTTTLSNAISADRMAHALLFTGPRGTGKTTIARILAKALACEHGPTPTPCNDCKFCKDITNGHCQDVFEIDGASNNSVDQIRDLRENVTYRPSSARVKVYIIDEVHMLSTAAFNALLKTLEEPPEHVIFIFATTEVHKIPATILSRCQRHDLSRIPVDKISAHLGTLSSSEGYTLDQKSLELIAMEADGSIRDSLSLLDRVLSASPTPVISHDQVQENLGVLDRKILSDLSDAVFQRNGAALISLVERVNDSGQDLKKFYADIIQHFRNLNIISICGPSQASLNLTGTEKSVLGQSIADVSQTYLSLLLQQLLENESLVRYAGHTQTAVEMVLLRLIQVNPGLAIDQIIGKLDTLAHQMESQGTVPPVPQQAPAASPQPQVQPNRPPSAPNHGQERPGRVHRPEAESPPMSEPPSMQEPPPMQDIIPPMADEPPNIEPQQAPAHSQQVFRPADRDPAVHPGENRLLNWDEFLVKIQEQLPFIFALLSRGKAVIEPDQVKVTLETHSEFEKKRLKGKNAELQALGKQYLGKPVVFHTRTEVPKQEETLEVRKAEDRARQEAAMHPLVQEAQRIFDGEIIL